MAEPHVSQFLQTVQRQDRIPVINIPIRNDRSMTSTTMTSCQRLQTALAHDGSDRVPLALGGGYLLAPSNHLQADVPAENVVTLFVWKISYQNLNPQRSLVRIPSPENPVGPGSTIGAAAVTNALKCSIAEKLTSLGKPPIVLTSSYFI